MKQRKRKRIAALMMAVTMVVSSVPVNVLAEEISTTGVLCEHHTEHTPECGYAEAEAGTPCAHVHGEECYTWKETCVHEHTGECYPQTEATENQEASAPGEKQADMCTHVCSEESGCITKAENCVHMQHDENCGFSEEKIGSSCTYVCEICNSAGDDSTEADESEQTTEPAESTEPTETECTCGTLCTDGSVDNACLVCGAEDADLTACEGQPAQEETQQILITGFDELPEEIREQPVPSKTKLTDLILPGTLTASGYTDAQDNSNTETLTLEGVTWEPDVPYDEEAEVGAYAFTAVLPEGYVLAENVQMPEIWVMVGAVNRLENQSVYTMNDEDIIIKDTCADDCSGHTITGNGQTDHTITVEGGTHNITIENVNISTGGCAFDIQNNANVTLDLKGNNTLVSGSGKAGLQVLADAALTINGSADDILTVRGGSQGAGIGGCMEKIGGAITINGGNILVTGGEWGAAIGDGDNSDTENRGSATIRITGGKVALENSGNGSGLGYGDDPKARGGSVSVVGGEVEFRNTPSVKSGTASVSDCMVAFPNGNNDLTSSQINNCLLKNGSIYTVYGEWSQNTDFTLAEGEMLNVPESAIFVVSENVTLTNMGTILNYGNISGEGMIQNSGAIYNNGAINESIKMGGIPFKDIPPNAEIINLNDVIIEDTCNGECLGHPIVGSGQTDHTIIVKGGTHNITIENVNISVNTSRRYSAFELQTSANVTLTLKGTNTLISGYGKAGLEVPSDAVLTINGSADAMLTAQGGNASAGIGGCMNRIGGVITINNGTIVAKGGQYGAAIGDGDNSYSENKGSATININDSKVILETSGNGSCLGYGDDPEANGGSVSVTGSELEFKTTPSIKSDRVSLSGCTITLQGGVDDLDSDNMHGCLVKDGSTYTIYGEWSQNTSLMIKEEETLVIFEGANYILDSSVILTNQGTIINRGIISGTGTIRNDGIIHNSGTIESSIHMGGNPPVSYLPGIEIVNEKSIIIEESSCSEGCQGHTIAGIGQTENTIAVTGGTHTITIENINISTAAKGYVGAFDIQNGANVTLVLKGNNTLKSGTERAGLHVPDGAALTIQCGTHTGSTCPGDGTGCGSLITEGSTKGAGIGGQANFGKSGRIIINSGIVTATGGSYSAGIGGSNLGENEDGITINGGIITATSKGQGAGIGGGRSRDSGNIMITGGTITAKSNGDGAGIGGGNDSNGQEGNITITGGQIIAGSAWGAGIGSGGGGRIDSISISNATVTATGGKYSAGIGGGGKEGTNSDAFVGKITIKNSVVTATGGESGAGIGGGNRMGGGTITINSGTVSAKGGSEYCAGIGGGKDPEGGIITINGGTVTATGGTLGAGIGGSSEDVITITGGNVIATGGSWQWIASGAGIGGHADREGGTIIITGGTIIATSPSSMGRESAGIGDGVKNSGTKFYTTTEDGVPGNAVIIASSIADKSNQVDWSGVIIEGSGGRVYGTVTPKDDFEIPSGTTLNIPSGTELQLQNGVAMTNRGTINVDGTLNDTNGVVHNFGIINKKDNPLWNDKKAKVGLSVNDSPVYGETITLTATVSNDTAPVMRTRSIPQKTVYFYRDDTLIGEKTVDDISNPIVLDVELKGKEWKPGTYTLKAKYTGGNNLYLPSESDEIPVTVNKADQTTPAAPTVSGNYITDISVILTAIPGAEYRMENANDRREWQDSTVFKNLNPNTEYSFCARLKENDYYNASNESPALTIKTQKTIPSVTKFPKLSGVYGTAVSAMTFDGGIVEAYGSPVSGTWEVTDKSGTDIPFVGTTDTYTVTFTPDDQDQYETVSVKVTPEVSKRPITVTADDKNRAYDTENPVWTFTVPKGTLVGTDTKEDLGIQLSCSAQKTSDAGEYDITGTAKEDGNYDVTFVPGKLIIEQIQGVLTVADDEINKTYGDETFSLGCSTNGDGTISYESSDESVLTVDDSGMASIHKAGDVDVTVSLEAGTNYTGAVDRTITVSIGRAIPQISGISASGITYGETLADSALTGTVNTTGTFEWKDDTVMPTVITDSGVTEYEVIFTPKDTTNWQNGSAKVKVTVNPAKPEISNVSASKITYGQTLKESVLSGQADTEGTFTWENVDIMPTVKTDSGKTEYKVIFTPTGKEAGNYTAAETTATVEVQKAPLTVTAKPQTITYGEQIKNGTDQITAEGLAAGDTVSSVTLTASTDQATENGEIQPSAVCIGNKNDANAEENYDITYVAGDLIVKQAEGELIIANTAIAKTYGEEDFNLGCSKIGDGTISYNSSDNSILTVSADGTASIHKAGDVDVTVSLASGTNYTGAAEQKITVSVEQAEAPQLTPEAQSYCFASGSGGTVEKTIADLLPKDRGTTSYAEPEVKDTNALLKNVSVSADGTLSYEVNAIEKEKTGSTASITVKISMDNYMDTVFTVNITITEQKTVAVKTGEEVSIEGEPKLVYGQPISDLTLVSPTFVETGNESGDPIAGSLIWKEPDHVPGANMATASWIFTPENTDYAPLEGNVGITVTKAVPELTEPNLISTTYAPDQKLSDLAGKLTGGKAAWEVGGQETEVEGTWSFVKPETVPGAGKKDYAVIFTPTEADKSNYTTAKTDVEIDVAQAEPKITELSASTITYGQTLAESVLTGKADTEGTFAWKDATVMPTAAKDSGVTEYTVIFTPKDTANWKSVSAELTVTVQKAPAAPNLPKEEMKVSNSCRTVEDVKLPDGWQWQEADKKTELFVGKKVTATAVYTGSDKGNYETEEVKISIYRASAYIPPSDGLHKGSDGKFYYYKNGMIDREFEGIVEYDGGEFFVRKGTVALDISGLCLWEGTWYFFAHGQIQRHYTGLAFYDGEWFYLEKGVLDTKRTGIVPYDGSLFIVVEGRIAREANGLWQDPADGTWYFAAMGQIQTQHTGVAAYDGAWFYIRKGLLATDFYGTLKYNGVTFKVVAGQLYRK